MPCLVQNCLLWRDILETLLVNLEGSFALGTDRKSNAETWGVALEHGDPSSAGLSVRKQWERGADGPWPQGAGRDRGTWEELWVEEVGGARMSSRVGMGRREGT